MSGTSPLIPSTDFPSRVGIAEMSICVYGCRGWWRISAVGSTSTMRPPRLAGSFSHEDATDELRKDGDAGELGGNRPGLRHALNNVPFPRLHRLPGQRANRLLLPRNVDILTPPDEQDLLLESNDIMVRRESPQGRLVALRRSQESQDLPHDLGGRFRSREYAPRQQRRVVHIDRFSDLESYG